MMLDEESELGEVLAAKVDFRATLGFRSLISGVEPEECGSGLFLF